MREGFKKAIEKGAGWDTPIFTLSGGDSGWLWAANYTIIVPQRNILWQIRFGSWS